MNNLEFLFDDEMLTAKIEKVGDAFNVIAGEKKFHFEPAGENQYHVALNGQRYLAAVVYNKGTYYIDIDSMLFELKDPSSDGVAGGAGGHGGEKDKIYAPMPGKIVKIMVEVGDEVTEKQAMVVVEAMKMENQVNCKAKGKVKAVNFSEGDQVDTESPIIELELE